MNTQNTALVIVIGLILRIVVPLALTVLIVYLLRKLDARWQAEARAEKKILVTDEMPCVKGLSFDQMKSRMSLSDHTCWQTHRLQNGYLNDACLECEVFLNATTKNTSHSTAHI